MNDQSEIRATALSRLAGNPAAALVAKRQMLLRLGDPFTADVMASSGYHAAPMQRFVGLMSFSGAVATRSGVGITSTRDRFEAAHRRIGERFDRSVVDEAMAWSAACLFDGWCLAYDLFGEAVGDATQSYAYSEYRSELSALGVPTASLPGDHASYRDWFTRRLASLRVNTQARVVSSAILRAPVPVTARAPAWVSRNLAVRALPAPLREAYGLPELSAAQSKALSLAVSTVRLINQRAPATTRRISERFVQSLG